MYEYLICAGQMKAGTTLLYDHLVRHPGIRKGQRKELHYFDTVERPSKAQYDSLFAPGEGLKMDITPFYMYYAPSVERMAQTLDPGKVAVVVLLRDPVERAFSHYRMRKAQGMEDQPFEKCPELESERTARGFHDLQLYSYFSRGLYLNQLERLYRVFPRENVRVLLFEDFVRDQQRYVNEICDFVGLQRIRVESMHSNKTVTRVKSRTLAGLMKKLARVVPKSLRANWMRKLRRRLTCANERKGGEERIDPAFEQKLVAYYRHDVKELKDRYGLDVSKWEHFASVV